MSGLHLRVAVDAKCRDCGGQDGGDRYWRVHVSACTVTECPLWCVRPIATRRAPAWLSSRNRVDLPDRFKALTLEEAIALIRGTGAVLQPEEANNSERHPVKVVGHG